MNKPMTIGEFAVRDLPYDVSMVSVNAGYFNRMVEYLRGNCEPLDYDEEDEPVWSAADLAWAEEQYQAEYGPINEQ